MTDLYKIFNEAPRVKTAWEHPETNSGLVLRGCPSCGKMETRKTYIKGFWAEAHELRTGYSCDMLYKCKCGQYCHLTT